MTKKIYVLNGPNLNRLGTREPHIYGHTTLAQVETICKDAAGNHEIVFHQSNREYELIDWIHEAIDHKADGIVINPAAFTFSSVAIMDALKMYDGPVIELHITNVHRREAIYHNSLISKVATSVIAGLGVNGYRVAVSSLLTA
ncbi:type II 3-dehydroquinate dehydratase [Brucellaceae bacterium C25G]